MRAKAVSSSVLKPEQIASKPLDAYFVCGLCHCVVIEPEECEDCTKISCT